MREDRKWVEIWLAENQRGMINCPYQPGNLVISKTACFRRYRIGQRLRDLQNPKFQSGYFLCGRCPIGEKLDHVPGNGSHGS